MSGNVQQAAAANSQGMNALRQGDFKAAAEAFERAVAADPASGALLRNLASAHRGAGDDEAELKALERALDIDRRDLVDFLSFGEGWLSLITGSDFSRGNIVKSFLREPYDAAS